MNLDALSMLRPQRERWEPAWPAAAFKRLTEEGVWSFVVPKELGGMGLTQAELYAGYRALSFADLNLSLIVANRDAGMSLLLKSGNDSLIDEVLPRHRDGSAFVGFGVNQLYADTPKARRLLHVTRSGPGFVLNGRLPWVTGAIKASAIVTGGFLEDGTRALFWLPTELEGLEIGLPLSLLSLSASCTSEVFFRNVFIHERFLLRGPAPTVSDPESPDRFWATAMMGVGLAERVLATVEQGLPEPLAPYAQQSSAELNQIVEALTSDIANNTSDRETAEVHRSRVNALLHRLAGFLMLRFRGGGYRQETVVQSLVAQCMFFSVFTLPDSLQEKTLARIFAK